jgi:hypothetical protein
MEMQATTSCDNDAQNTLFRSKFAFPGVMFPTHTLVLEENVVKMHSF